MSAKTRLQVVQQQPVSDRESAFADLEARIRDVNRAARIAFLMTLDYADGDEEDCLGLFAAEQCERLTSELVKAFYAACDGKAVQS